MSVRIAVVGAGPSGLTATKTLTAAGFDVTCFETSPRVGGHWLIDNPSGRSAVYDSLTTNTTKFMSRFSDYAMPDDWPEFPSHSQVQQWLEGYVERFELADYLRLGIEVERAEPVPNAGWSLRVRDSVGTLSEHAADVLIAASGNYWDPKLPSWPGEFNGELLHSRGYRSPDRPVPTRGKRVVVVGLGNTACDLAVEMADAGADVRLSARSGTWILPRFRADGEPMARSAPFSNPSDEVPTFLRWLPEDARMAVFTSMTRRGMRKRFGPLGERLQAAGLPAPPSDPLSKRPTVNQDVVSRLADGAIAMRGEISELAGEEVIYRDGTREAVDVIVCATGYHVSYPYLDQSILDTSGDDVQLFRGTLHPTRNDLFVIGISRPTGGFWPIAEAQAQFAAAMLTGEYVPPTGAAREKRVGPVINRIAMNPALYALGLRDAVKRGRG